MLNEHLYRQESFLTLQRIRAAQARYWIGRTLGLWFLCSVLMLMLGLSAPEQQRHAASWAVANVAGAVNPTVTVSWQGNRYAAGELARYLNDRYYGGTFGEWLWWAGSMSVVPVLCIGGVVLWYVRRGAIGETHIRGAEVIGVEVLQRRLKNAGEPGITIAGVRIPKVMEQSHILVCGATGAGKSVTIRTLLRQYAERNEVCVVVDPEGEFVSEFFDEARGDHLVNPFDARCVDWKPVYEGEEEADIAAQAASLFPVIPGSSSAAQYYHTAARRIYRKILEHGGAGEPRTIPEMLEDTAAAARHFGITKEMVSTLQNACEFFRHLRPGRRRWSAREWVEKPQGWVFLTFREADKEAALPFISLALESLTRRLLSRPIGSPQTVRVVIDELAVLKAQESLEELLTRARKRNVSVVLGFQDIHQLYPVYGKDMTHSMLNQPSTRLLLRTNDSETQEWCASNIGRREVARAEQSETVGPENVRDSFHLSRPRRSEDAVMGSEFGQFPNLTGILKVAHYGAARVTVPFVAMEAKHPAFLPREEPRPPAAPPLPRFPATAVDLSPARRRV